MVAIAGEVINVKEVLASQLRPPIIVCRNQTRALDRLFDLCNQISIVRCLAKRSYQKVIVGIDHHQGLQIAMTAQKLDERAGRSPVPSQR